MSDELDNELKRILGVGWLGIQEVFADYGIHTSIASLKRWRREYNLPLLRLPNGKPAITAEMVSRWIEFHDQGYKKEKKKKT